MGAAEAPGGHVLTVCTRTDACCPHWSPPSARELVGRRLPAAGASVGRSGLACATLVLRRRYPLAMPPLVTLWFVAAAAAGVEVGDPASWIVPMTFAAFAAGRYAGWPAHITGHWPGAVSVLAGLAGAYLALDQLTAFSPDLLFGLIGSVLPWLLGRGLRRELDRSASVAAEAERVRLTREQDLQPRRRPSGSGSPASCTTCSPTP